MEGILPESLDETSTISLPKPHKDITIILQLYLPNEYRCKNLQLNTSKENPTTYKKITYHDQAIFIPECKATLTYKYQCNILC